MSVFSRNVPLLAIAQALMMSGTSLLVTAAALVGLSLAPDKSLSTLPLAIQFIATMLLTIPAAALMARFGRKPVFMASTLLGAAGALLAVAAIVSHRFWWFAGATALIGAFNGFGVYFRFAAADIASAGQKAKAVSFVMAGGVAAAIIGPNVARYFQHSMADAAFAGSFVALLMIYLLAFAVLAGLRLPPPEAIEPGVPPRPLGEIVRQPRFRVAMLCGMLGYGTMSFLMTATPLAMRHHHHPFGDSAFVIQWHILAMFVPSFFTGYLIRWAGVLRVMLVGALLGLACVAINLSGAALWQFWLALVLLGVSWNFLFVGATTLATQTYHQSERAKAQAVNDFSVFTTVAVASLSAGALQHLFGWRVVNIGVTPLLVAVLLAIGWLWRVDRLGGPMENPS